MLVNLSDVFTSEGKVTAVTAELEMTDFHSSVGDFPITEKLPVSLRLTNIGIGKVRVEGEAELTFETSCDRCLAPVPTVLSISFEKEVVSPDAASSISEDDDNEDSGFMEGYQLNVEAFVHDEILLNWPMKILCRDDCKGICKVCGKNLNEGSCDCDTFVPDPRMAAIKDIFERNKEV